MRRSIEIYPSKEGIRMITFLKDSAISIGIGLFLLFLFEMGIRLFWSQTESVVYENDQSLGVQDAQLGYAYRPGAISHVKGPEFSAEYKINQEGLRDEAEHKKERSAGSKRVLLLGDSFTFGVGANYDKIWPVLAEKKLAERGTPIEIVKAGAAAFDTQTEYLYLTRLFPRYQPDLVVVAFLPNDLHTNTPIPTNLSQVAVAPNENSITLTARSEKRDMLHSVTLLKRFLMRDDLLYLKLYMMTVRAEFFKTPRTALLTKQLGITQDLFLEIQRYCQERKVDLLVVSIPQQVQILFKANDYKMDGIDINFIDNEFSTFASAHDFRWATTLPALLEDYQLHRKELFYRFDGHLTERGNIIVGDVVTRELERW